MLVIMYLSQFAVVRYCVLGLLLQLVTFVVIFSSADESSDVDSADEQIAFGVGEGQQALHVEAAKTTKDSSTEREGYIMYCPCMGRFGNQADQFMGAIAFAKGLNRTLVLPPWVVYPRNIIGGSMRVPFKTWFRVKPLKEFHRVITMEKFMKDIAPTVWPKGERIGFCYRFREGNGCSMKEGNPFGSFWDHFKIDFDEYREHSGLLWDVQDSWMRDEWSKRFPIKDYPVLAFMGAPGSFPCERHNRWIQKYIKWSDNIRKKADKFINDVIPDGPFIGIHLRNGRDFKGACEHVKDTNHLFASTQCIDEGSTRKLTYEMCFPSEKEIVEQVKKTVKKTKAKSVFVATDDNPLLSKLSKALKKYEVTVHQRSENDEVTDPIVDLAILSSADHFIGNCVSSFSAFAKRMRDSERKPSTFWAFDE